MTKYSSMDVPKTQKVIHGVTVNNELESTILQAYKMISLRSISQIICKARNFYSFPMNKLHSAVGWSPNSTVSSSFLSKGPSNFANQNSFLQPSTPLLVSVCGMKVKMHLQRRCKDCRLVFIDGVLHNLCSMYGRHSQAKRPPHFKTTRIVTHSMQSKKRPW